jgi:hypothetical protein
MKDTVRIGLIGDYNPDVIAHIAIPQALKLAARKVECIRLSSPTWRLYLRISKHQATYANTAASLII